MPSEPCWYCGQAAIVWCDHRLGSSLGQLEPVQLQLGEVPPTPPDVVETCDAAACEACRVRTGWTRTGRFILCVRGRGGDTERLRGRGCHTETTDRCHVHALAGDGSAEWIGAAGAVLARAEVRAACCRANDVGAAP